MNTFDQEKLNIIESSEALSMNAKKAYTLFGVFHETFASSNDQKKNVAAVACQPELFSTLLSVVGDYLLELVEESQKLETEANRLMVE